MAMESIGKKIKNLEELIALREETLSRARLIADSTISRAGLISIENFDDFAVCIIVISYDEQLIRFFFKLRRWTASKVGEEEIGSIRKGPESRHQGNHRL